MHPMIYSHNQHTLAHPVTCSSIGMHTGANVSMRLLPAEPDSGIVFRRMDIDDGASERSIVPARYDRVTDTMLGTTIENEHGVGVATIEHLMAALWGYGLDNVVVEIHGPEVPIMDGSSEPFMALLAQAGLMMQRKARRLVVITAPVQVEEGASRAMLRPFAGMALDVAIDFPHAAVARQQARYDFSVQSFSEVISRARTFGFASDVAKLRAAGLARGGSLDNAIVIGEEGILNEGGLRFEDEFVRHKALDCLGDYFLAGYRIVGEAVTTRPGHSINNKLIRALYKTPSAWRLAKADALADTLAPPARASGRRKAATQASGPAHPADALMSPER